MSYRFDHAAAITAGKVIGIVRASGPDEAVGVARALRRAGLGSIEVSLNTPGALEAIRTLADDWGPDGLIGAGTVRDPESARLALVYGAQFLVSPSLEHEVLRMGHRYCVPVIPGVRTATELDRALAAGADLVKLFPASSLSPRELAELLTPFPGAPLVPTGGVGLADVPEWLRRGAAAVGLGGALSAGTIEDVEVRVHGLLATLRST